MVQSQNKRNTRHGADDTVRQRSSPATRGGGRRQQPAGRQQRRRRKKHSPAFFLFVFLLLAASGIAVSVMVYFNAANIEIAGTSSYTAQQIIDASGIKKGQNLFSINRKQTQKKICEKLPYIKEADVQLKPLTTVKIQVTEDTPAAIVRDGDFILIDSGMKVLEVKSSLTKSDAAMLITGLTVTKKDPGMPLKTKAGDVQNALSQVLAACRDNNVSFSMIGSVDLSNLYDIVIRYDKRIDIHVGTQSNLGYKLETAKYIIEKKLQKTDKGKLDVSSAMPDAADGSKYYFDAG